MKYLIIVVFLAVISLFLPGCAPENPQEEVSGKVSLLAARLSLTSAGADEVVFDFGRERGVNETRISWGESGPAGYELLVSVDGRDWHQVALLLNQSGMAGSIMFDPQACRYIKVKGVKSSGKVSVKEIEFFGPAKLNPDLKPIPEK